MPFKINRKQRRYKVTPETMTTLIVGLKNDRQIMSGEEPEPPPIPKTLAATSATKTEIEKAKKRMSDGSKPVEVEKRPYRPKMQNVYIEPEEVPDELEQLDLLFGNCGAKAVYQQRDALPPRDDIISFDEPRHAQELRDNLQLEDCPAQFREQVTTVVKKFWDEFVLEGMQTTMRGYKFNIDTGTAKPVCCKAPRYGPHEARVITRLADKLVEINKAEQDFGPYGALVVLAAKPHQGHVHWSEYIWRLCVSYRLLNAITRPFVFPSRRCDDAARDVGASKYFITMDLMQGYWQMELTESAKPKTAFFIPNGKLRMTCMPMGATNAHPAYNAVMELLKQRWDDKAAKQGIDIRQCDVDINRNRNRARCNDQGNAWYPSRSRLDLDGVGSENIVDDIIVHARTVDALFEYFEVVLGVLQDFRITVSLRKCRFLQESVEFVGLDIEAAGNRPAKSKDKLFENVRMKAPESMGDLRLLIGLLGFYQEWIPLFEVRISRWREYQRECLPGQKSKLEEQEFLKTKWVQEDEALKTELLDEIKLRPVLLRPDFLRRFFLKTDWGRFGKAAVLLQADPDDEEAKRAEEEEAAGGKCVFDAPGCPMKFRLLPIAFISARNGKTEHDYHSYIGEAKTGLWAMSKFRRWLVGARFTWMTDCSGLRQFFEAEELPSHASQRWRMQMLLYDFTIVHRPEKMMKEVDTLNRYNYWTNQWRVSGTDMTSEENKLHSFQALVASVHHAMQTPVIKSYLACPRHNKPNRTVKRANAYRVPFTSMPIRIVGPHGAPHTRMAEIASTERTMWITRAVTSLAEEAAQLAGIVADVALRIEDREELREIPGLTVGYISTAELENEFINQSVQTEWLVSTGSLPMEEWNKMKTIAASAIGRGLRAWIHFEHRDQPWTPERWEWLKEEFKWERLTLVMRASDFGAAVESVFRVSIAKQEVAELEAIVPHEEPATNIEDFLDEPNDVVDDITPENQLAAVEIRPQDVGDRNAAQVAAHVQRRPQMGSTLQVGKVMDGTTWTPVFDTRRPGPDLAAVENSWYQSPFAIEILDETWSNRCYRGIRMKEIMDMVGMEQNRAEALWTQDEGQVMDWLRITPPAQLMAAIFAAVKHAEDIQPKYKRRPIDQDIEDQYKRDSAEDHTLWAEETTEGKLHSDEVLRAMTMVGTLEARKPAMLPLPNKADWQAATNRDTSLRKVIHALEQKRKFKRTELPPKDRQLFAEWQAGRLDVEEGILYRYEASKQAILRQVRAQVVPRALREVVFGAMHAAPIGGHSGYNKTLWRTVARFWWPNMAADIKRMAVGCATCRAVNITSHDAQQILRTFHSDVPFDVMCLDVWTPGKFSAANKWKAAKLLTGLCVMTGFAGAEPLQSETAEDAAYAAFKAFFVPRGLPKLIIIDAGGAFAGFLLRMCALLGIPHHTVAKENHRAILCERFHRYLNKVEVINAAECASFQEWVQGSLLALYAWNAAPVDGTNVCRSVSAIGRKFPFPIDVEKQAVVPRLHSSSAAQVIDHMDAAFPLLMKQRQLLKILTEDRREHHRLLKNCAKNMKEYSPGDLVVIRKQVTSAVDAPAKLMIRARGPYRVLQKERDGTYLVQRIPFVQGAGRKGVAYKESAARMELLPSPMVLHKKTEGVDTRLAVFKNDHVPDALQNSMGVTDFGGFTKAAKNQSFAFDRIEDLWPDAELEYDWDSDDSASEGEDPKQPAPPPVATKVGFGESQPAKETGKPTGKLPSALRRSGRYREPPQRFKRTQMTEAERLHSPAVAAARLYRRLTAGLGDTLFIIRRRMTLSGPWSWFVVEVLIEESDPDEARQLAYYKVRKLRPHPDDCKVKEIKSCRFWPEIHETRRDGSAGRLMLVKPQKVKSFLSQRGSGFQPTDWEVNLIEDGLVGPFPYVTKSSQPEGTDHMIPNWVWKRLRDAGANHGIDTDTVNQHPTSAGA